jgi:anaerobic C4-dicarboxylate transporter
MLKSILFAFIFGALMNLSAVEKDLKKSPDVKEKVLYMNKKHYDKSLQKNYEKSKKNKKEMKIYKRADGSIDTFRTINEANR